MPDIAVAPAPAQAEVRQRDHVLYVDARTGKAAHALVRTVFSQAQFPTLTLVMVRPGELGILTRSMVPHKQLWREGEAGWWCFSQEHSNGEVHD